MENKPVIDLNERSTVRAIELAAYEMAAKHMQGTNWHRMWQRMYERLGDAACELDIYLARSTSDRSADKDRGLRCDYPQGLTMSAMRRTMEPEVRYDSIEHKGNG